MSYPVGGAQYPWYSFTTVETKPSDELIELADDAGGAESKPFTSGSQHFHVPSAQQYGYELPEHVGFVPAHADDDELLDDELPVPHVAGH